MYFNGSFTETEDRKMSIHSFSKSQYLNHQIKLLTVAPILRVY